MQVDTSARLSKVSSSQARILGLKMGNHGTIPQDLYGNNFVICTDNNQLIYVLTNAKLDATGHHWVASRANYISFALSYQSGKMNVDVDVLTHILKGEHDQHIEAHSVHALISQVAQGTILMEAYSCKIRVTETLDIQIDPKAMLVEE